MNYLFHMLLSGADEELLVGNFMGDFSDWGEWCAEPFAGYLARCREIIERHRGELPPELRRLVPVIFGELLPSYGSVAGIGSALARLSRRLRRENPLRGGEEELLRCGEELMGDFRAFAPELFRFAEESAGRDLQTALIHEGHEETRSKTES